MKNLFFFPVLLAGLMLPGCGETAKTESAVQKYALTFATTTQDGTHWAETWKIMKAYVEEKSAGRLTIDLSFGGALGNDTQLLQKVQVGSQVHMAVSSGANLASIINIIKMFDVPFFMNSSQAPVDLFFPEGKFGGKVADGIQPFFAEKNLRLFGVVPFELRGLLTRKTPVNTPAAMKGLKIRVTPNPVEREIMKSLGAGPTTMGISEVYTAIQTGTVDGLAIPPITAVAFALGEVGKEFNHLDFQLHGSFSVINSETWNKLPKDLQDILQEGLNQAIAKTRKNYDDVLIQALAALKSQGVNVHTATAAEKEAFKKIILEPAKKAAFENFTEKETAFYNEVIAAINAK